MVSWAGVVPLGLCCCWRWGEGVGWRCAGLCTSYLWENIRQIKKFCLELYQGYPELYLRVELENLGNRCPDCWFVTEVVTLRVAQSCVAVGITLYSPCLVCCTFKRSVGLFIFAKVLDL